MHDAPSLILEPIFGPPLRPVRIDPALASHTPCVLGRSSSAGVQLSDPQGAVSRNHAAIEFVAGEPFPWRVRDLGSRHGTFVNGQRLGESDSAAVAAGDQVRIGPWVFRAIVGTPPASRRLTLTSDHARVPTSIMQRVGEQPLEPRARTRLSLLMSCAAAVAAAKTEEELAQAAVGTLLEGTGLCNAAMVRPAGMEEVEVLCRRGQAEAALSRSLMSVAADPDNQGETVVLDASRAPATGQSIVSLDISAAVCVPVMVERLPTPSASAGFVSGAAPRPVPIAEAYLYLDARGAGAGVTLDNDTVAFCQAVAKMCGLALTSLKRAALEQEDHRRRSEIEAARDVQRIIMPPDSGEAGGGAAALVRYHMHCVPGRFVAGDLFDFVRGEGGRVAVLLGDVVGKGVAAGMVMANVQAHLSRLLSQSGEPGRTLTKVNQLVSRYSDRLSAEHGRVSLFVSLFAVVIDPATGEARYADAGHGYALLRAPTGSAERLAITGGPPLGVAPDAEYAENVLKMQPGTRLVVYSDGLAEQRSAAGRAFAGTGALEEALAGSKDPREDVTSLIAALRAHSGLPEPLSFADDVTVASIAFG